MNLYLDIDGVLLANDKQAALHAEEFIAYAVTQFPVYWLTTHCRNRGDDPVPMLTRFFAGPTLTHLKHIRPSYWDMMKTEAIDFTQPFLWFDDDLFDEERDSLIRNNAFDSWVEVDLANDETQLQREIVRLTDIVSKARV